jgi:hypothetical protein
MKIKEAAGLTLAGIIFAFLLLAILIIGMNGCGLAPYSKPDMKYVTDDLYECVYDLQLVPSSPTYKPTSSASRTLWLYDCMGKRGYTVDPEDIELQKRNLIIERQQQQR